MISSVYPGETANLGFFALIARACGQFPYFFAHRVPVLPHESKLSALFGKHGNPAPMPNDLAHALFAVALDFVKTKINHAPRVEAFCG
mgnify:CR=1 FL=1